MKGIKQFAALSLLTAIEAIRQPICLLLTSVCVLLIALLPLVLSHTLGEAGKLVRDSALAFYFVFGLLLSVYIASATLDKEKKRGTVSFILSKPVRREIFVLSKFAGGMLVVILYSITVTLAVVISARTGAKFFSVDWWSAFPLLLAVPLAYLWGGLINFFTHRTFTSNTFMLLLFSTLGAFIISGFVDGQGSLQAFGAAYDARLFPACILICLATFLLQAFALTLATRLPAIPTLCVSSFIFLLGLMSDYFFGRHVHVHPSVRFLYYIVPNWQHFWMADALSGGGIIPCQYLLASLKYTILYLIGLLNLGFVAFRTMEIN